MESNATLSRELASMRTAGQALSEQLGKLKAERDQLVALKASFEWLTNHVNRLETERNLLTQRVLGMNLPPMQLERVPDDPPTPTQSRIVGRPREDDYASSIPAAQAMQTIFEDIGDDAAKEQGIEHDEAGNVVYTR